MFTRANGIKRNTTWSRSILLYTAKSTRFTLETILWSILRFAYGPASETCVCSFVATYTFACMYTYALATPARYERRGTGRRVRSLNFDPEMATARPLCAWPSTTGRRDTRIRRTVGETFWETKERRLLAEKR